MRLIASWKCKGERIDNRPVGALGADTLVSAVASYAWGAWRVGGRFQLATGLPHTKITGATWSEELQHYLPEFGRAYGERLDTLHQLDVRIERTWRGES